MHHRNDFFPQSDEGIAFRGLYIIDDKKTLRHYSITDMGVGRSADETIRLVTALKFYDEHGEVCPAGWVPGDATIKPDVEGAKEYFNLMVDDETLEYLEEGFKNLNVSNDITSVEIHFRGTIFFKRSFTGLKKCMGKEQTEETLVKRNFKQTKTQKDSHFWIHFEGCDPIWSGEY